MRVKKAAKSIVPTEADEQKALFEWIEWAKPKYPALWNTFHIPNEGRRSLRYGREMVAQGMRSGVPDIFIASPARQYAGLFIEMKRRDGGRLSNEQKHWLDRLNRAGYLAVVCNGWEEARNVILEYLRQ